MTDSTEQPGLIAQVREMRERHEKQKQGALTDEDLLGSAYHSGQISALIEVEEALEDGSPSDTECSEGEHDWRPTSPMFSDGWTCECIKCGKRDSVTQ